LILGGRDFCTLKVDCPSFNPYFVRHMRPIALISGCLFLLASLSSHAQVHIKTAGLPDGMVGVAYDLTLQAVSDAGGLVWAPDRLFAEVPEPKYRVTTGGTAQHWQGDDGCWGPVPLPFAFPYFGSVYTQCFINTEGTIRFDTCDLDFSGSVEEMAEQAKIAVLWSDWWTDSAVTNQTPEDIYLTLTHTSMVVRWQVEGWEAGEVIRANFQATLMPEGIIRLAYDDATRRRGLIALSGGRPDQVFVSSLHAIPEGQLLGSRLFFPIEGLPRGLRLTPDGRITGIPEAASTNLVSIIVRDAAGQHDAMEWVMTVRRNPTRPPPSVPPAVDPLDIHSSFAQRFSASDSVHSVPRPAAQPSLPVSTVVNSGSARRFIDLFEMDPQPIDITMHKYALLEQPPVQQALRVFDGQMKELITSFKTPVNQIPELSAFMLEQQVRSKEPGISREAAEALGRVTMQGMGQLISLFHEAKLREILTSKQLERLDELIVQMRGPILLALMPDLAVKVELDSAEQAAVLHLVQEQLADIAPRVKSIVQLFEQETLSSTELRVRVRSLIRILQERDAAILACLPPEKCARFVHMQGESIALDWDASKLMGLPFQ
jgi:hypothetical protein